MHTQTLEDKEQCICREANGYDKLTVVYAYRVASRVLCSVCMIPYAHKIEVSLCMLMQAAMYVFTLIC